MSWVQTASGKRVDLLTPSADQIDFKDVSWALSRIGRFNGHTNRFYSVAQHCLIMSQVVPAEIAIHALLHDAAEAFIGDIPAPLKELMPEFEGIEVQFLRAIYLAAGVPLPDVNQWSEVRMADLSMLLTERNQLMEPPPEPWAIDSMDGVEAFRVWIAFDSPGLFATEWLERLNELREKMMNAE
jgi:hypothetical protein